MTQPRKLRVAVIREELVALTGSLQSAVCLGQMLYWAERTKDTDAYIQEERARNDSVDIEPTHGWIYKTAKELNTETMLGASESTIGRRLKELVDAGWLQRRRNPLYKWDKTWQYRPDLSKITTALAALGYTLNGYALGTGGEFLVDDSISQDDASVCHSDRSNVQPDRAIPETISETISEKLPEQQAKTSRAALFQMIQAAGVMPHDTKRADMWAKLLDTTDDMGLIQEAFDEVERKGKRPNPNYIESILERCLREGVRPGQWKGSCASPPRAPAIDQPRVTTLPPNTPYEHPVTREMVNGNG